MTLDLSALPPARRPSVLDAFLREDAAARVPDVYARVYQRAGLRDVAYRETADALNHAMRLPREPGAFHVTARFVQAVMREGR